MTYDDVIEMQRLILDAEKQEQAIGESIHLLKIIITCYIVFSYFNSLLLYRAGANRRDCKAPCRTDPPINAKYHPNVARSTEDTLPLPVLQRHLQQVHVPHTNTC